MNRLCIYLLLPVACVISMPAQYVREGENHELPNEFWSLHFGPDFQHAIHRQLDQTDLIGNDNAIATHMPPSKEGNRKRSAYIIHKPNNNEQEHQAMGNSMRVNLLQPAEIEALEREMVNFARGNQMVESPVVVNLPPSEGSVAKGMDHETPLILNVPPVVYHENPSMQQSPYMAHMQNAWAYNGRHPSYDQMHTLYQNAQPSYDHEQSEPAYEENRPSSQEGNEKSSDHDNAQTQSPSFGESNPNSYEDKPQPTYETDQIATDGKQDAAATV